MSVLLLLRNSDISGFPKPLYGPQLEVQLTPGVWTNIIGDVIADEGIRWRRGLSGTGPTDCVASTGTLEFTLRNDALNSGLTAGWYSPHHANVRSGWTYGIPCRLLYGVNFTMYPLFYGKIRSIHPTPGLKFAPRVAVLVQDAMGDFAEYRIRNLGVQITQSETALLQAIIDGLSPSARPVYIDLDQAVDIYPVAFDNVQAGVNGLQLLTDIVVSARGCLYVTGNGSFTYRNRKTLARRSSELTLSSTQLYGGDGASFEVPSSMASAYNRVRVTVHPKSFSPTNDEVLYAATGVVSVPGLPATVLWGTYSDPDNPLQTVGGMEAQPEGTGSRALVPYLDYEANTLPDGTGTDRTANLTVTATPYASGVEFSLSHLGQTEGYGPLYLVTDGGHYAAQGTPWLRLRGRAIYDNGPITMESSSTADFGDRVLEVDLPLQDDPAVAQSVANYLRTIYEQATNRVEAITLNPQAIGMANGLDLDITDVITVSETVTGLSSAQVAIQAIEGEIMPLTENGYLLLTLHTRPILQQQLWILGDPVASILGSTTRLGWVG